MAPIIVILGFLMHYADTLSDLLRAFNLRTKTYFCSDFKSPWGLDIAQKKQGMFHVVIEGRAYLKLDGHTQGIWLNQGDIIAFPTGGAHQISDAPNSATHSAEPVVAEIQAQNNPFWEEGAQHATTLLCGEFDYASAKKHPFLKSLPCVIHIEADRSHELEWLRRLMRTLSTEARAPSLGSELVMDRITEILYVQLLRYYIASSTEPTGYLSALADDRTAEALHLIHQDFPSRLSIENIASEVGLSRSAFSERFTRLVGMSPKSYQTQWRLNKAQQELGATKLSMFEIASNAGYQSEAAFSKAFRQQFGEAPGATRKRQKISRSPSSV